MNFPLTIAERIALTLNGLYRAVAARVARRGVVDGLAAAVIVLVCRRVRRAEGRILGLLRRFQAGRLVVLSVRRGPAVSHGHGLAPAPADGGAASVGKGGHKAGVRLPRRFGWLLPLVPSEAACFAGQLRATLLEPEMVALLDKAPQARLALRPLCTMLGVEMALLRFPACVTARAEADVSASVKQDRVKRPQAQPGPWRIPLPHGVLTAARREGFAKRW